MIKGTASLRTAGGAERTVALAEALDAEAVERAHERANAWIKSLRQARVDAVSLRDRFGYRGDSLWWFTELYLHKNARVLAWHLAVAAWRGIVSREAPLSIGTPPGDDTLAQAGREVARGVGIGWHGPATLPEAWRRTLPMRMRARYLTWSALASRQRGADLAAPAMPPGGVLAFVHTAFWRHSARDEGEEQYLGPVLREIEARAGRERLALVGVGPRTNFRARRWWHAAVEASPHGRVIPVEGLSSRADIRPSLALWRDRERHHRTLVASADLRALAYVDGCDMWPLVADELEGVTWLQWPWSARAMDEAGAALDRLSPSAVLTYAEAGGWGRAIVLGARRRGIPSVGVQHGFIYRHWLNYLHGEDEFAPSAVTAGDAGFPAPTRTLLFDEFARRHLEARGHFPPERMTVTGSPGQQALRTRVAAATPESRAATRAALSASGGASGEDRLLVVVTKHAQMRRAFPALVRAVATVPAARLVVKCHPAETAEPYARDAAGSPAVTIAPASVDLAALLSVASVVVTVNSTVAIDAMTLGVPALVVDLPNNLSPFVEAGVMAGAASLDELAPALRRLLDDDGAREGMRTRQQAFLAEFGGPAEGAAARAADEVLALAGQFAPGSKDPGLQHRM